MPPPSEPDPWQPAGRITFAALALVVTGLAILILWPFLTALALGAMLVVLTYPYYARLCRRLGGRRSLAALLMLVGVTVLLVLPAGLIVMLLVNQAELLIDSLQAGGPQASLAAADLEGRLAPITRYIPNFDAGMLSAERWVMPLAQQVAGWVQTHGQEMLGGLVGGILGLMLGLLATYYFYLEGEMLLAELKALSPLPGRYSALFGERFAAVIDATFRGQAVTSLAQGVAVTAGLLISGVPGAFLWGAVSTVLSLLPMVGAAIVWVPATLYLALVAGHNGGSMGWAIFLGLWGVLVVSTIDNVVRPWVMKGKAELPAIPLLFAVLGGLQIFGFVGLVVGPLVFSLLVTIVEIYQESFAHNAQQVDGATPEKDC
jgi:predicted PurR-regulated permease PerM